MKIDETPPALGSQARKSSVGENMGVTSPRSNGPTTAPGGSRRVSRGAGGAAGLNSTTSTTNTTTDSSSESVTSSSFHTSSSFLSSSSATATSLSTSQSTNPSSSYTVESVDSSYDSSSSNSSENSSMADDSFEEDEPTLNRGAERRNNPDHSAWIAETTARLHAAAISPTSAQNSVIQLENNLGVLNEPISSSAQNWIDSRVRSINVNVNADDDATTSMPTPLRETPSAALPPTTGTTSIITRVQVSTASRAQQAQISALDAEIVASRAAAKAAQTALRAAAEEAWMNRTTMTLQNTARGRQQGLFGARPGSSRAAAAAARESLGPLRSAAYFAPSRRQ